MMRKDLKLQALFFAAMLLITSSLHSQGRSKEVPVLKEISGLEVIKTVFPNATAVEKSNDVWFRIIDSEKKLIGYTMSSKPYSGDIQGYHNTTPVVIVLDKERVIKKVAILSHWETASYVTRLERLKFFDTWNGLKPADALKKRATADSYTGATITASAVSKNVEAVLKKAIETK